MDLRVGTKFVLRKKLGAGSFGEIYAGEHIITKEAVAAKLELAAKSRGQLANEVATYKTMEGGVGIPSVKWFGVEGKYNVLIMDLLGPSIASLFGKCGHRLSLKTVLMITDQLLTRIEYIHNKSMIHRDIKPDNFVIGGQGGTANQISMIDMGLAKNYRNPDSCEHVVLADGKAFVGTARYASLGAHAGTEQGRRDDLESIAYVLVYLLRGTLPWMGVRAENRKKKREQIGIKKAETAIADLCEGLPEEFARFLTIVRDLEFDRRPDYADYRNMFKDLFIREGFVYDYKYDWCREEAEVRPPVALVPAPQRLTMRRSTTAKGSVSRAPMTTRKSKPMTKADESHRLCVLNWSSPSKKSAKSALYRRQ